MKGINKCPWLHIGSTERCGKSCMGEYCNIHIQRIRKGGGTKPCLKCGIGVKNMYMICGQCGYHSASTRDWNRASRTLSKEFTRLAAIEISC